MPCEDPRTTTTKSKPAPGPLRLQIAAARKRLRTRRALAALWEPSTDLGLETERQARAFRELPGREKERMASCTIAALAASRPRTGRPGDPRPLLPPSDQLPPML